MSSATPYISTSGTGDFGKEVAVAVAPEAKEDEEEEEAPDLTEDQVEAAFLDRQGRYRTASLFFERNRAETKESGYEAIFNLGERDKHGTLSLKQLYLKYEDPTEYHFALKVFGSWDHWQKLLTLKWFLPYVEEWRGELETKLESNAILNIINTATHGSEQMRYAANKTILTKPWKEKAAKKQTRGRPSKQEVEARIQEELDKHEDYTLDAERLGIGD